MKTPQRGRWYCEATLGGIAQGFEKVFALDDAILGQISTVNGISYTIAAKDRPDTVGVKFLGYSREGGGDTRQGWLRLLAMVIFGISVFSIPLTHVDIPRTRMGAECLDDFIATIRLCETNLQRHHRSGTHFIHHLSKLRHDASVHL